jgi:hypothetical protein
MTDGPEKITVGEMRQSGFTGVQIYCADHKCSHVVAVSVEDWPDDIRLSDLEGRFTCSVCGHRCADIRPDWQSLTVRQRIDPGEALSRNRAFPAV